MQKSRRILHNKSRKRQLLQIDFSICYGRIQFPYKIICFFWLLSRDNRYFKQLLKGIANDTPQITFPRLLF